MLSLIIDILVLGALGATIFYAIRLSAALNNFRAQRRDFEKLMENLSANIAQAQTAVQGMKISAQKTAEDLQEKINDAAALCDEMQLITETANNLARRLEGVAVGKGQAAGAAKNPPSFTAAMEDEPTAPPSRSAPKSPEMPRGGGIFAIQDRDFEDKGVPNSGNFSADVPEHLQSEAERDLYRALARNKKG